MVVVGMMREAVVVTAKEDAVVEVGVASVCPGLFEVVGLGPGGWSVTALGAAALVAQHEGDALGSREEALFAAEVEDGGGPPRTAG